MTARRRSLRVAALVLAVGLGGVSCAPRPAPAAPTAPRFPDFVFPAVPAGVGDAATAEWQRIGWEALQANDLRRAERGFSAALKLAPDFFPAAAGLGYLELARQDYPQAVLRFDAALARAPTYAPALVGRGEALLALDRPADALATFEAALTADASLAEVRRRVEVLRFRNLEAQVAEARQAAEVHQYARAREAYERALATSPDSAFLHRELAVVERELDDSGQALAQARRAVELDPSDPRCYLTLGEIHTAREEFAEALAAFERADAIDSSEATRSRVAAARERAELGRLPAEFRAIPQSPAVTRGQLAALIAVRLAGVLSSVRSVEAAFITDTRGHWAAPYILAVARAGVMEVYPNYTFQPDSAVHRGELASVVSHLLAVVAATQPALAERWRTPEFAFTDLPRGHLSYPAAALAALSGVLPPLEGNTFQLARVVTGADAIAALERIEKLAGRTAK